MQIEQSSIQAFLSNPQPLSAAELAAHWHDRELCFIAHCEEPVNCVQLGAHLRRSFLGALHHSASEPAKVQQPCPWDPPCTLDIFRREQLRSPKGDGMPKPYIVWAEQQGIELRLYLRVFGAANDWFYAAAEAFHSGLCTILPWQQRLGIALPKILDRRIAICDGIELDSLSLDRAQSLRLRFLSPVDVSGKHREHSLGQTLVSRLVRRVDAIARWQGVALIHERTRALAQTIKLLDYDERLLVRGQHKSDNAKQQERSKQVVTGILSIKHAPADLVSLAMIASRCSIGRGAVEGLGRVVVEA